MVVLKRARLDGVLGNNGLILSFSQIPLEFG